MDISPNFLFVVLVIALSLVFTYTNGLQDGSSVAAGLIVCRILSPLRAVLLVAICELCGALLGGSAVAYAVKSVCRVSESDKHLLPVLCAGLIAAILWNLLAKRLKIPASSTHALFGGLLGALLALPGGSQNVAWGKLGLFDSTGFCRVIVSLFASPALGFAVGFFMLYLSLLLLAKASNEVNRWLKLGQAVTVSLLAFGHGANDPQKSMGIILLALSAGGMQQGSDIPVWIRLLTGIAIAFGVMSMAPGIVKKVGTGIFKLRNLHGFVTEAASSFVINVSSLTGCPVSTSQVISSTIMGVGTGEHFKDVRWLVARDILISWFLTIPCAALVAYVLYLFVFSAADKLILGS